MSLRERIIQTLVERRNKILRGEINCIPSPFVRFREDFPGIEQRRIYLVSGGTKAAKSMITNYLFVVNTLMFCYKNPNKVTPKIFYFPLEEDKEAITTKIMAYILYEITNGNIYISPTDLMSTDADKPLPQEVLNVMESEEFVNIMNLYEEIVTFYDESNRIGINKVMTDYAKTHGKSYYETYEANEINEITGETTKVQRSKFDYYVADNPDEYVIVMIDHLSLLNPIKGEDLRLTISEFAKDCVKLRNWYGYTIVGVQQQNIESTGLAALQANKILPTVAGLADCKDFGKACNLMFGIVNPSFFDMSEYYGYNIKILKGAARFLQITINRNGVSNGVCPLMFLGKVASFYELPLPNEKERLEKAYKFIESLKNRPSVLKSTSTSLLSFTKNNVKSIGNKNLFSTFAKFFTKLIKLK